MAFGKGVSPSTRILLEIGGVLSKYTNVTCVRGVLISTQMLLVMGGFCLSTQMFFCDPTTKVTSPPARIPAQEETLSASESLSEMEQAGGRPAAAAEDGSGGHRPEYGMLKSLSTGSLSAMARAGAR